MSTPVSRPSIQSKIPRPVRSRTRQLIESRSSIKTENCLQQEPICRLCNINDTTPKSTQQSEFCDEVFVPNTESLESILNNNERMTSCTSTRGSTFEDERRSSVYYIPPRRQSSIQETHMEFKQNMKALQEKLRLLNIKTPVRKIQDTKKPSTPTGSIYYKIQPISKDRAGKKMPYQPMSERKVLTVKSSKGLCQSASKLELSKGGRGSTLYPQSAGGKENKSSILNSASFKSLQHLSLPSVSMKEIEEEEVDVPISSACSTLGLPTHSVSSSASQNFQGRVGVNIRDPTPTQKGHSSQNVNKHKMNQVSHETDCKPLVPLSLLMTPTPPRSQVLYSTLSTPTTPKYSSVLSSDTLSTWTVRDVVSTPILSQSQVSSHSWRGIERMSVLKRMNNAPRAENNASHAVCSPFVHQSGSKPQFLYSYDLKTQANIHAITTPELVPRAPALSSCLKSVKTHKSSEQGNLDVHMASCAKKLRWADMSAC